MEQVSANPDKRMQENSARNQILIREGACERIKDEVEERYSEPMAVKGKNQPVEGYEVVGLKKISRRKPAGSCGLMLFH